MERSGPETVLPPLLEKSLERGWRALVRTTSEERVAALDDHLWTYRDDAFLPHGRDDRPDAEQQPVLLAAREGAANHRQILLLVDGAAAGDVAAFERVIHLFDGQDEAALAAARACWADHKRQGHGVVYWRQNADGRWEKQA